MRYFDVFPCHPCNPRLYALVLTVGLFLGAPVSRAQAPSQKPLDIYFIDVEGGQATLLVSPSGESMLVDTGFPGYDGRDLARIEATAKQAGVSRIDYLVITHYHTDHVGNVPALAPRIPIRTFVDHGPTVETGNTRLYDAYVEARKSGRHLQVKPGDKIPIAGLDVTVVAAGGQAHRNAASRRRRRQSSLRGTQAEGRGPFGERAIGRDRDRPRAFPDAQPRRSHLEQGARPGVPCPIGSGRSIST